MNEETKTKIDNLTYEQMFRLWRFSPSGDPLFTGSTGDYFTEVFVKRREEVGPAEHTRISKLIGWEARQ